MYKYIKGLGSIWVGEVPPPTPSNNVIWMRIQRVDGKKGYHELLTWNVFENKWQHLSISELESNAATVDWVNHVIEEHNSNDQAHEDIRDTLRQCVEDIASVNPDEISAKIEAEKQARIASDNQLSTDINAEETRATNEETLIRQEFKEADQTILSTVNKSISDSLNSHNTSSSSHQDIRTLLSECVGLPEYNSSTYEITFTTKAGQKLIIDLPIEQLALKYNPETQSIEFQNGDGTTTSIPVSEFLTEYIGSNGTEIIVTIGENNSIKASLVNDSITLEKLAPEIRESLTSLVTESFVNEESIPAKANASIGQSILTSVGNPSVSNNSNTVTIKVNKKTRASSTGEFGEEVSENLVIPSATVTNAGVMSATDKAKLDNIPENVSTLQLGETSTTAYAGDKGKLNKDILDSLNTTNISDIDNSVGTNGVQLFDDSIGLNFIKKTRSDTSKTFGTGTNVKLSIPAATQEKAGVMSAADKTALDTMEFSSINLIDESESITVSAPESNNYYSKNIPILGNVSAGDNFSISIDAITDVAGVADTYTINIYDKSGSTRLSNTLSLSKDNRSGVFEILSTVDSQEAILRLFAGYSSETSNHTVRYDKVMLVRGNHPSKVWAPSANDLRKLSIGGVNLIRNAKTMIGHGWLWGPNQGSEGYGVTDDGWSIAKIYNQWGDATYTGLTLKAGHTYTLSAYVKYDTSTIASPVNFATFQLYGSGQYTVLHSYVNDTFIEGNISVSSARSNCQIATGNNSHGLPILLTNDWKRMKVTVKIGDSDIDSSNFRFECATDPYQENGENLLVNGYIYGQQIEEGCVATALRESQEDFYEAIDNINIGGVNLLDDSEEMNTWSIQYASHQNYQGYDCVVATGTINSQCGVYFYKNKLPVFESNKEFISSVWVFAEQPCTLRIGLEVSSGYFYNLSEDQVGKWTRVSILQKSKGIASSFVCYADIKDPSHKVAFRLAQLEEGNKITTWAPSVNDILSESLTQAKENDKNYLPLTGGTLSGQLTANKGISAFDENASKTEFNTTGKIGDNTQYSTPLLIKTKQANANWNFQFEDKLKLLIGPQNGIPIKLYGTTSKSALYATELYQDNKIVATQEWVLQQLANYISKIGDSTISGTLTANAFKES